MFIVEDNVQILSLVHKKSTSYYCNSVPQHYLNNTNLREHLCRNMPQHWCPPSLHWVLIFLVYRSVFLFQPFNSELGCCSFSNLHVRSLSIVLSPVHFQSALDLTIIKGLRFPEENKTKQKKTWKSAWSGTHCLIANWQTRPLWFGKCVWDERNASQKTPLKKQVTLGVT